MNQSAAHHCDVDASGNISGPVLLVGAVLTGTDGASAAIIYDGTYAAGTEFLYLNVPSGETASVMFPSPVSLPGGLGYTVDEFGHLTLIYA